MNVRLGAKTKEFNRKMQAASVRLKKFGRSVSAVGRGMTTMLTMPIALAGAASIKLSLDFQKSMTKIQTLVGKTGAEIEVMKAGIMEMSTKTAKSPVELAEGLYFLESAGLRGANAMETLESVAKGSASGLGDMEALSVVAAAAQNAYGEETLSASDALDKFGVMVRTGMFDAQELSNVLGRQLGLASNLGISFDEVGALISTYTQTTGDATAATNGLSAIMMTFAKLESEPTKKQAEALDAIGMSAGQVKEMMAEKGLMGTMQHLQTQFEKNNIPMADFFTKSQALKGALGVLGTQTEAYTANLDAMGQSADFVGDAFEVTAETDAFKMEQAMNNLTVAGTSLGDSLAPVVQKISDKIMDLTNWWNGLDKSTQDNYASWLVWIATVGPALMLLGGIISKVGAFIGLMKKFKVIQTIVTAAQWLWNVAMTANPIGAIIAVIALVIAAIVYFATSTGNTAIKVRNFFKMMMNGVIGAINAIIKGINKYSKYLGFTIPTIQTFTMEQEKATDVTDENADAVGDLNKELENIPDAKTTTVTTNFDTGGSGGDDGDDGEAEKTRKKKEDAEKRSLEKIRKLKQEFNVLNESDKQKSELIALKNSEDNALLGVADTKHAEAEKQAIRDKFGKKREALLDKHQKQDETAAKKTKTAWEKTFEALEKGWNNFSNIAGQVFGAVNGMMDAIADKEQMQMDNKIARENEEHEIWYERELLTIEQSGQNEEQKEAAIKALDETAAKRKEDLEKKQDAVKKEFAKKAAKRDKANKIMSAIMGTAQAIVTALGSTIPPFNFILAGVVAALGAAQIAAIASTPIPALAEGGMAFGPTVAQIGEYRGASSNPEVIAPLSKLEGMLGGGQKIEVFGRIEGNDIFLSNDLAAQHRLRFT